MHAFALPCRRLFPRCVPPSRLTPHTLVAGCSALAQPDTCAATLYSTCCGLVPGVTAVFCRLRQKGQRRRRGTEEASAQAVSTALGRPRDSSRRSKACVDFHASSEIDTILQVTSFSEFDTKECLESAGTPMHESGTAVTMHQKESHPFDGLDVQGSHGTMKKFKDIFSDRVYIRQPEVSSGSEMSLGQAANNRLRIWQNLCRIQPESKRV